MIQYFLPLNTLPIPHLMPHSPNKVSNKRTDSACKYNVDKKEDKVSRFCLLKKLVFYITIITTFVIGINFIWPILGDTGAVSHGQAKSREKSFKNGRRSPWVPSQRSVLTCDARISINIRIRSLCPSEDSHDIGISVSFLLILMLVFSEDIVDKSI